jgi:hypothetical protein
MHETVLCDEAASWSSLLEIPFALGIHYYAGKFFDNKKVKLQMIEPLIQNGRRRVKELLHVAERCSNIPQIILSI